MKRWITLLLLLPIAALAQISPYPVFTTEGSGTIAVTNTFQQVLALASMTAPRNGCLIQNTGSHVMYVFFGPIANATTGKSFILQPPANSTSQGGSVSCNVAPNVLWDQVSITGTISETYTYASQ